MRYIMISILSLVLITNSYVQGGNKMTVAPERYSVYVHDSLWTPLNLTQENIIGVWINCATTHRGVTMHYNECPIIEFKSDNSAIIRYASLQDTQVVTWVLANEMLQIDLMENTNGHMNRMLKDRIYEVQLKQDSLHYNLKLKAKNNDVIYSLGREK